MMILARKKRESVVVGCNNSVERMLKVTVIEINDEGVLLGFETNNDFPVQPWEMWERIRALQTSTLPVEVTTHKRF